MKELTAEQLLEYRGVVSQFAKTPSLLLSDAEQLASLREAILQLGLAKDDGYLDDFKALVFSPEYSQLPEKEWLHSTICRLLPPAVKAEDVPLFAQVISSGDYSRWVREQATMTLSARYQLKQDLNKEIAEAYLGIMTGKFSKPDKWHIALSIICTGLCIGGKVLKKAAADFYENYGKELKDGFPPMVFNAIMNMPPEQIRETIGKNTSLGLDNEEEERKMIANPELPDESELERVMKPAKPIVRAEPKINRNDPCPCGSGKKYKKCCGK